MYTRKLLSVLLAAVTTCAWAQTTDTVRVYRYAGPYSVAKPVIIDSLNVAGDAYDEHKLIDTDLCLDMAMDGALHETDSLPLLGKGAALHLAAFDIVNEKRAKVKIKVEGCNDKHVYVDGKRVRGESTLNASRHHVVIKALTIDKDSVGDTLRVSVEGAKAVKADKDAKRFLNILDLQCGERCYAPSLSPDGKYLIFKTYNTNHDGKACYRTVLRNLATGRDIEMTENIAWLPHTNKYRFERTVNGRRQIIVRDPETHIDELWADNLPSGNYTISPTEDFLVFSLTDEGPKKDKDVYEVIEPDDRQGGFRTRTRLAIFDLKTKLLRPLTHGHHSIWLNDISQDGQRLLLMSTDRRLTERPTTLYTIMQLHLATIQLDTLVCKDGFVSSASYSPDGKQILIQGSPDCLGGIGRNIREGQTANEFDKQLYLMSLDDRQIRPLTKHFNPSVDAVDWNAADNHIYIKAEDRDCEHLFRLNPATGDIQQLPVSEDYVASFTMASNAPVIAYYGQGLDNTSRLYLLDLKKADKAMAKRQTALYETLLEDFSARILADVQLGESHAWPFVTSRGDTLANGYVLPPDFDPEKQYPMVVYYYGGTSPTSRMIDHPYSCQLYAAMGYVVLYVNPSGATGFGQEWSARHVNTAGEGVAEDIIESAQQFCALHPWVNAKKVGCIGASYGGFMTQLLQTKTDFFAAAISHAGISAYSSYWGEGYWGYSYSEAERAGSYPWNRRDLFVDRSPLFNADKIHTPLLFLHGTADTNVPIGESIQMFTALKLLGRETAFVAVEGENHGIHEFKKRQKWQDTIFAWFARWLQDDDSWWKDLYGDKSNL